MHLIPDTLISICNHAPRTSLKIVYMEAVFNKTTRSRISRIVFWVIFFKLANIFQVIISIKLNSFLPALPATARGRAVVHRVRPCPWRGHLTSKLHPKFSVKVKSFTHYCLANQSHNVIARTHITGEGLSDRHL
jgi:hypothetical protein